MKRIILCVAATAALLAVPALADAQPIQHRHHTTRHTTRHTTSHTNHNTTGRSANKYTGYHGGDTTQGNSAVDQLNAQSLARARGTAQ